MAEVDVLVAGAAGMMGRKIVRCLLDEGAAVRVLVRPGPDAAAEGRIAGWRARGVEVAFGDLRDEAGLREATRGAGVVISAVQGGEDVVMAGQAALARAARANGARRFFPSDLSIDFLAPGIEDDDHVLLGWRRRAGRAIAETGIAQTHVLVGAFMEAFLGDAFGLFDLDRGRAAYWGDGAVPLDLTATDDAARYLALAALDPDCPTGPIHFAGDRLNIREAIAAVGFVRGAPLAETHLGSLDDLRSEIATARAMAKGPGDYAGLQYQRLMLSGLARLTAVRNARYPQVRPARLAEFLAGREQRQA